MLDYFGLFFDGFEKRRSGGTSPAFCCYDDLGGVAAQVQKSCPSRA